MKLLLNQAVFGQNLSTFGLFVYGGYISDSSRYEFFMREKLPDSRKGGMIGIPIYENRTEMVKLLKFY